MTRVPTDILDRLAYFHREVDALFRRLFEEEPGAGWEDRGCTPPLDVEEGEDEIVVRIDLPGVAREEIELHGAPGFLVIRGVKRTECEARACLRLERSCGSFQRLVALPAAGDPARIRAHCALGVLEVRIPKVAERRRRHRRIPIE